MYYSSAECEEKALLDAAFALCAAARTAPKGRGRDFILTAVVTGQEKEALARATERLGERYDAPIFLPGRRKHPQKRSGCADRSRTKPARPEALRHVRPGRLRGGRKGRLPLCLQRP